MYFNFVYLLYHFSFIHFSHFRVYYSSPAPPSIPNYHYESSQLVFPFTCTSLPPSGRNLSFFNADEDMSLFTIHDISFHFPLGIKKIKFVEKQSATKVSIFQLEKETDRDQGREENWVRELFFGIRKRWRCRSGTQKLEFGVLPAETTQRLS